MGRSRRGIWQRWILKERPERLKPSHREMAEQEEEEDSEWFELSNIKADSKEG